MEFLKILGIVLTYCAYSTATLTAHLNSDFRLGNRISSQSSRADMKPYPGSSVGLGQSESHKTYDFDYKVSDGQGNTHYHKEGADGEGTVTGTYGYRDVHGLYRVVDYIADAKGFRAKIQTNEPGAGGRRNPSFIEMMAERPSADFRQSDATPLKRGPVRRVGGERQSVPEASDDDDAPPLALQRPHSMAAAVNQAFAPSYRPGNDEEDEDDEK